MLEIMIVVTVILVAAVIGVLFYRRSADEKKDLQLFTEDDSHLSQGRQFRWDDYLNLIGLVVVIVLIIVAGVISGHVKIGLYLTILYLVLSVKKVDVTELGAILFFGKPLDEVEPGPVIVPFMLFTLVKETLLVRQDQIPADPERIDKTDTDTLAPGKVFPIRVTHKAGDDPKDPLDQRMTTEVTALVRYRIQKGQFIQFLQTVQNLNEARRQMRDTLESEIKKQFAKRTPSETIAQQKEIDAELKTRLETLTDSWGVQIVDAQIVDIDLGQTVNKALRDVPASLLNKKSTITNSEAKREEAINLGIGVASAKREMLKAEAAGREALLLAEAIGTEKLAAIAKTPEGQITLWLDTIRAGFEKSNHTIIPGGEFFGSIASLTEVIEKVKGIKK